MKHGHCTIFQKIKKLQTFSATFCPAISQIEVNEFFRKVHEIPADSYVVISVIFLRG
jgi:hypothetical protein